MKYLNLSSYKFIELQPHTLAPLRDAIKQKALEYHIKGTVLLSPEGINLFIAGEKISIDLFTAYLTAIPEFSDLWFKTSESGHIPFKRMLVRIKHEIITMKQPDIQPEKITAPYLEPAQLKAWYVKNKEMIMLDARNMYEFEMGTFDQAVHLAIENFSDFPQAIENLPDSWKTKTIVTFCTGGIRCEKAAAYLLKQGFKDVWQLKGGIIHYFEQCGGEHFQGRCFVFDERVAVEAPVIPAA